MSDVVLWTLAGLVLGSLYCVLWYVDRQRYIKIYLESEERNRNLVTTLCDVYIFLGDPVKEDYRRSDLKQEIDNLIRWNIKSGEQEKK